jgi:hypothetical protein
MKDVPTESMIHYQNPQTRKFVVGMLWTALLSCPVVICLNLMIWSAIVDKTSALDDAVLAPAVGLFILLCFIIDACALCPSIVADDDGLVVTSCIFIHFAIPWEQVIDIWEYDAQSRIGKAQGRTHSLVRIGRGLTPLHRSLPRKEGQHWRWFRGFMFASASSEYNDLVRAIEAHTGPQKELRTFYKPQTSGY